MHSAHRRSAKASCLQIAVTSLVRVVFSVQRRPNVMYRFLGRSLLIAALVTFTGVAAFAQKDKDRSLTCRDNGYYNDRLVSNCEIREQTLAPSGSAIAIDGRQNGGIS